MKGNGLHITLEDCTLLTPTPPTQIKKIFNPQIPISCGFDFIQGKKTNQL
jgi:hypothetical protein